ncbi:hypothetical protein ACFCX4_09040 [Kitasatospora sp. NPDC056327]|uniref:hypothetical protein n=1 Tax=Kitasatospora sp. NPDC056327 TaxID=3345785 RepID=UPI0035E0FD94
MIRHYPTRGGAHVVVSETPLGSGGPTLTSWKCAGCGAGPRSSEESGTPAAKRLDDEAAAHSLQCTAR